MLQHACHTDCEQGPGARMGTAQWVNRSALLVETGLPDGLIACTLLQFNGMEYDNGIVVIDICRSHCQPVRSRRA